MSARRWNLPILAIGIYLIAAFGVCVVPGHRAQALEIEFSGRSVKLDILALYDRRQERAPHLTRIHQFAEMPLNHLGFRLTYHDVNAGLPSPGELARYRGVLTWFAEPLAEPDKVLDWLEVALARGLKYVVMGAVAPPVSEARLEQVNRVLARIGLSDHGETVDMPWKARVLERDPEMVGFERPVDKALPSFSVIEARRGDAEPHLVLEAPLGSGTVQSTLVATAPGGGFADDDFTVHYEPNTNRVRWTLNPFAFFARAFGDERRPIPDTTTLAGRRMYFSHIDGDGWNNVSEIEGYREAQKLSAEVVEREAIVPYPDLPVSVGLIASDANPALGGNLTAGVIARRLFALPQVEVASHTNTHPFNWQFFESYDRAEELRLIESHSAPALSLRERFTRGVFKVAGRAMPVSQSDKYVAGSDSLPRTYMRQPFDIKNEVAGALKISESFAPPGKRAGIYLWSGDTTPFSAAIRTARLAGVYNMNGGDSRLDAEYPSVTYVPPISRMAGDERQIYAGNSNENTYTNDWTGPYYGQFMLVNTLANTESPRRLKPFNLYYHMYSGERPGALAAVRHILDIARKARVIPVKASTYAAIANDFFSVDIVQVDLFSWAVSRRGSLSTVRFDDASQLAVDLTRSRGVLGSVRHEDSLFVSLDPAVETAVVTLRGRSAERAARNESKTVEASLVDSRWALSGLVRESCGFRVTAQGFGTGDMLWLTSPRRGFRVSVVKDGKELSQETRWADDQGQFAVRFAPVAVNPVTIRFACHG
ncbi:MAG: hypothetical protein R3D67_22390 [Hyphomicrobiaceae bacterium]